MTDKDLLTDFPTQKDASVNDLRRREETHNELLRRSECFSERSKNVNNHKNVDLVLEVRGVALTRKTE